MTCSEGCRCGGCIAVLVVVVMNVVVGLFVLGFCRGGIGCSGAY